MKNLKFALKALFAVFAAAMLLNGCIMVGAPKNNVEDITLAIMKELISPYRGEQSPAAGAAAKGANDFAFRLSAALLKDGGNKNFICSPLSVWLPLAALVNATDSNSKAVLFSAIGAAGLNEDDLNGAASRMLYSLTNEQGKEYAAESGKEHHNPVKIVNAVFVDKNLTLRQEFAQTFVDFYRGSSIKVDFSSQEAVESVNKWAMDSTDGLIDNIIERFEPETAAAIANAIYFSDRWNSEFDPGETEEGIFKSPGGDANAFYMLREGEQPYYEDDKIQAVPLKFKTDGGMCVILPKDGDAAGLLTSMTGEYFDKIINDSANSDGKLLLPRFSIESDVIKLDDALVSLGVPLFDAMAAPLTGGLIKENVPVWVGEALQKAAINVDEKGTTAAAVTMVVTYFAIIPEPAKTFEMKCDRPFVFILYGGAYGGDFGRQILFTGIVNEPAS
ncbi:MAG: hypothetical protein FWF08_00835 [Oscillospiraceae bacterium]|nr:hypothetical protein [Oscillospiraceae bacterium]